MLSAFIALTFIFSSVMPPAQAQTAILNLPVPGTLVTPTLGYTPAIIKGLTIHPDNALEFDFIVGVGDGKLTGQAFEDESKRLIKYFMAALTTPEEEMWVNLSPYEQDRIIANGFGDTKMGRDMLVQDYLLKQLTASLMYPEDELGKKFWDRVYTKAQEQFGTTEIPMNTFNKIWIVPEKAVIFEKDASVFVVDSHLKVMLEEDYVALNENRGNTKFGLDSLDQGEMKAVSGISSDVVREVLIPEIEKEVNQGKIFANLRQVYNSSILASWYKKNLKESLLGQIYVDQGKTKGVDTEDKQVNQKIYEQYVEAFKKGVYNYIKEDLDPATQEFIPRKYFSGGITDISASSVLTETLNPLQSTKYLQDNTNRVTASLIDVPKNISEDLALQGIDVNRPAVNDFNENVLRENLVKQWQSIQEQEVLDIDAAVKFITEGLNFVGESKISLIEVIDEVNQRYNLNLNESQKAEFLQNLQTWSSSPIEIKKALGQKGLSSQNLREIFSLQRNTKKNIGRTIVFVVVAIMLGGYIVPDIREGVYSFEIYSFQDKWKHGGFKEDEIKKLTQLVHDASSAFWGGREGRKYFTNQNYKVILRISEKVIAQNKQNILLVQDIEDIWKRFGRFSELNFLERHLDNFNDRKDIENFKNIVKNNYYGTFKLIEALENEIFLFKKTDGRWAVGISEFLEGISNLVQKNNGRIVHQVLEELISVAQNKEKKGSFKEEIEKILKSSEILAASSVLTQNKEDIDSLEIGSKVLTPQGEIIVTGEYFEENFGVPMVEGTIINLSGFEETIGVMRDKVIENQEGEVSTENFGEYSHFKYVEHAIEDSVLTVRDEGSEFVYKGYSKQERAHTVVVFYENNRWDAVIALEHGEFATVQNKVKNDKFRGFVNSERKERGESGKLLGEGLTKNGVAYYIFEKLSKGGNAASPIKIENPTGVNISYSTSFQGETSGTQVSMDQGVNNAKKYDPLIDKISENIGKELGMVIDFFSKEAPYVVGYMLVEGVLLGYRIEKVIGSEERNIRGLSTNISVGENKIFYKINLIFDKTKPELKYFSKEKFSLKRVREGVVGLVNGEIKIGVQYGNPREYLQALDAPYTRNAFFGIIKENYPGLWEQAQEGEVNISHQSIGVKVAYRSKSNQKMEIISGKLFSFTRQFNQNSELAPFIKLKVNTIDSLTPELEKYIAGEKKIFLDKIAAMTFVNRGSLGDNIKKGDGESSSSGITTSMSEDLVKKLTQQKQGLIGYEDFKGTELGLGLGAVSSPVTFNSFFDKLGGNFQKKYKELMQKPSFVHAGHWSEYFKAIFPDADVAKQATSDQFIQLLGKNSEVFIKEVERAPEPDSWVNRLDDEEDEDMDVLRDALRNTLQTEIRSLIKGAIDSIEKTGEKPFALEANAASPLGGINFNTDLIDWQIKRDGNGIPLPMNLQPIEAMQIDGFVPVILNVTPVSLPMLLGLNVSDLENELPVASGQSDSEYDDSKGVMPFKEPEDLVVGI